METSRPKPTAVRCLKCEAMNMSQRTECIICGASLEDADDGRPTTPAPRAGRPFRSYRISLVLMVLALAALVMRQQVAPTDLLLTLPIVALPAILRAWLILSRRKRAGERLGVVGCLEVIITSVVMTCVVAAAVGMVFLFAAFIYLFLSLASLDYKNFEVALAILGGLSVVVVASIVALAISQFGWRE